MSSTRRVRAILLTLILLVLTSALVTSETVFRLRRPFTRDHDDQPIDPPQERGISDMYNITYNTWARRLSLEEVLQKNRRAVNVNAWDEVPDSSWFTNRMGVRSVPFQDFADTVEGAPPKPPPWYVRKRNDSGYTPKVEIVDNDGKDGGRNFVLKFDPKGARERNSGAERIGTLIMHAAGYNVPHNTIVYFGISDLRFDEKSYYTDPFNHDGRLPLTKENVDAVLRGLDPMPNGKYRGIASLRLAGTGLDPFRFTGMREDDKNDYIPHDLRRELRGLGVIAAWINHVDIKDNQAKDMFMPGAGGKGYVKHYLLDFSATLGAYEWPIDPLRVGHEYMFDGAAMGKSLVSLGIWRRPWKVPPKTFYNEIGYFSADLFEPDKWKPSFPNLAFEQMDDSDGYWGAKIVTAFSNDTIKKLSEAGDYQRREATLYVEDTLKKRRDAIGMYWLNRVTPLETFVLAGGNRLQFVDLGIDRGYASRGSRKYGYWIENLDGRRLTQPRASSEPELAIADLAQAVAKAPQQPADQYGRTPMVRVLIQTDNGRGDWALPVEVFIGRQTGNSNLQVLGWTHAPGKR
jgi:hypothetical protein